MAGFTPYSLLMLALCKFCHPHCMRAGYAKSSGFGDIYKLLTYLIYYYIAQANRRDHNKNSLRRGGEENPAEAFAKGGNSDEHQDVS